jgi:hypothetical protein
MTAVSNFLRSVLDDLVEKRLWPVAVALVLAMIAIPVLLSSSAGTPPAPAPPVTSPAVSGGGLSAFEPVVSTEGKKSSEIRKDLEGFQSKDPFKPQNLGGGGSGTAAASASAQPTVDGSAAAGGSSVAPAGGTSGSSGSSGGTTTSGGDTSTGSSGGSSESKTFYYAYTVDVRFGKEGNLDRKTLTQLRSLPSSQDPVVVFMGVKDDGETAIFLVSSEASTTGEGNCEPDDTCTFLYMKDGDEQTIEAVNAANEVTTYRLVLLGIDVKRTAGPQKAESSSRRARSKRSRRAVKQSKDAQTAFERGIGAIGF